MLPIPAGFPECAAADRDHMWFAEHAGGLFRVDAARLRIDRRTRVPPGACGTALGEGSVWVASWDEGSVTRIDPESGKVLATIPVAENAIPASIAVGAGGVWVDVHPR